MRLSTTASQIQGRGSDKQTPSASRWRVSDLVLDTRRQRVWRDSSEIPLPKMTYDLLFALVRHHPTAISDDDLIRIVWPGVVVSQETLSQRVKLLRAALGDDSRNPRYVARLRGRAYHLVGQVGALPDEEECANFDEASGNSGEGVEADAPLSARDELAILEPEWEAEHCDRPEWTNTQVIADELTSGIFPALAQSAKAEDPIVPPSHARAWDRRRPAALIVAGILIAVLTVLIVLHLAP
jgi:DNA-binding winged helix-turn-helix (wHTH) protein